MKGILEFDLYEENEQFVLAQKASDLHSVIWDIDSWLRQQIKYENRTELQKIRDKLWDIAKEHNVEIW